MNISKEELYKYYIEDDLSTRKCGIIYNCSRTSIEKLLKKYGIVKEKTKLSDIISKEELYKYYIEQDYTTEKCANIWNCSRTVIEKLLKKYNIVKNTVSKTISREDLYQYYIIQNHTTEECGQFWNCSRTVIEKLLKKYNIEKSHIQKLQKRQQTCSKLYGVDNPMKSNLIQSKLKQSCLEKYGVEFITQSSQMKENSKKSCLQKYGTEFVTQSKIEHYDIWSDDELFTEYVKNHKGQTGWDIRKYFNVNRSSAYKRIHKLNLDEFIDFTPMTSHYESEIINWLQNTLNIATVEQSNRNILEGQEIDIYLPDYKIGIEFNGDYWHSDLWEKFQDHKGRSTYHQEKSLLAEQKGVFLFHIFEHEWNNLVVQENIKNRLMTILQKNKKTVGARECKIIELTKKQKKQFLNQYHVQGDDRCSYCYGLEHNGEIVSCMTFGKSKFKKYNWELSRFCSKHGFNVCGGASKLLKYFLDTKVQNGENIVSYNDITKTQGKLYEKLGFKCMSINNPNYVWINLHTGDVRTRYQEQAAGEVERMHELGYHRVCDCGTKTWVYTKEE